LKFLKIYESRKKKCSIIGRTERIKTKMKQKITLVQKVANLEEYQKMVAKQQLPIVLKLTDSELQKIEQPDYIKEISTKQNFQKNEEINQLYRRTTCLSEKDSNYLYMNTEYLRNLIKTNRIYIPEFIDSKQEKKYVDYIYQSDSAELGSGIVFRETPRFFFRKKEHFKLVRTEDAKIGIKGGNIILAIPFSKYQDLFSLCMDTIWESPQDMNLRKVISQ